MFLLGAVVLSGCSETCAPPQPELNQQVWSVFVQPVTFTVDGEGFPAESSPGNGTHELAIEWTTPDPLSPVVVTIDGQPFEGTGNWSVQECGNFVVGFSGVYAATDGATHAFGASAELTTWPGHLDGFLDWTENWRTADDANGSYTAEAQMFGIPRSAADES